MDNDIDKLKKVISKQDIQIKALYKITTQLKKEIVKLKLESDQLQYALKRNR